MCYILLVTLLTLQTSTDSIAIFGTEIAVMIIHNHVKRVLVRYVRCWKVRKQGIGNVNTRRLAFLGIDTHILQRKAKTCSGARFAFNGYVMGLALSDYLVGQSGGGGYDMSKCCISGGALDFFGQSLGLFSTLTSSCYEKGRVWTLFLTAYIPPFLCESITVCGLALTLMLR